MNDFTEDYLIAKAKGNESDLTNVKAINGIVKGNGSGVFAAANATDLPITDTGNYFATDNAGAALQQIGASLDNMAHKVKQDFEYRLTITPFNGSAIASGTLADGNGTAKHPGVIVYSSSTSANSGYAIKTGSTAFLLAGKEKSSFIFKTAPVFATVTRYMGFHSGGINSNEPSYGAYIAIDGSGVATGKVRNGGTADSSVATAQLLADTWYRATIEVNADGSAVAFNIFADDSDTTVLSETLVSAKVPKAQVVGVCDSATSSGTTAIVVGSLDYIDYVIPNSRKV